VPQPPRRHIRLVVLDEPVALEPEQPGPDVVVEVMTAGRGGTPARPGPRRDPRARILGDPARFDQPLGARAPRPRRSGLRRRPAARALELGAEPLDVPALRGPSGRIGPRCPA